MATEFTPFASLLGGVLIGIAATMLLLLNGRVSGISGIFGDLLTRSEGREDWRFAFIGGLISVGLLMALANPSIHGVPSTRSLPILLLAGALVGVGVRMGSGCTSGHGVCGISRLSMRSMTATMTFMGAGFAVTLLITQLLGGAL